MLRQLTILSLLSVFALCPTSSRADRGRAKAKTPKAALQKKTQRSHTRPPRLTFRRAGNAAPAKPTKSTPKRTSTRLSFKTGNRFSSVRIDRHHDRNRVVFTTVGRPEIAANNSKGGVSIQSRGKVITIEKLSYTKTAPMVFSTGGEIGLSEGEYVFFLPKNANFSDAAVEKIILRAIEVSVDSDITRSTPITTPAPDPFI